MTTRVVPDVPHRWFAADTTDIVAPAAGALLALSPGARAASSNALPPAAIDATGSASDTQPPTAPTNLSGQPGCDPLRVTLTCVTLSFAGGQAITQIWGAQTASTSSPYSITNASYNGSLAPNASTTFGFLASGDGANAAPTVTCAGTP